MFVQYRNLLQWIQVFLRTFFSAMTSPLFYAENFKKYTGYGIKYLMVTSICCSCIFCAMMLKTTKILNEYFAFNQFAPEVALIDRLIKQFPTMDYDGHAVRFKQASQPIALTTQDGTQFAVIDPENQVTESIKSRVPCYVSSLSATFNIANQSGEGINSFHVKLRSVLGEQEATIDSEYIRALLAKLAINAPNAIIFIIFPVLACLILGFTMFRSLFPIIIVFGSAYFFGVKNTWQKSTRVVLFASGTATLVQMVLLASGVFWYIMLWFVEFWVYALLVTGLLYSFLKMKQELKN